MEQEKSYPSHSENGRGTVITFYSYKGGTGRSMALANSACHIASRLEGDSRVLVIDWDLEAPGLHRYFAGNEDFEGPPGILNYFEELRSLLLKDPARYDALSTPGGWRVLDRAVPLRKHILGDIVPKVDLLAAGQFDESYNRILSSLDWQQLYRDYPAVFDAFHELLANRYEYVLIDSRTGLTDIAGICTGLLPEKLVAVFTPNRQSLDGLIEVLEVTLKYRKRSDDVRPLAVFPLPSRIDASEELLKRTWRAEYQGAFEKLFKEVYDLEDIDLNNYLDEVQIPHKSYYAYGEKISVLDERADALSLRRAFESFTDRLTALDHPWEVQSERVPSKPAELAGRGRLAHLYYGFAFNLTTTLASSWLVLGSLRFVRGSPLENGLGFSGLLLYFSAWSSLGSQVLAYTALTSLFLGQREVTRRVVWWIVTRPLLGGIFGAVAGVPWWVLLASVGASPGMFAFLTVLSFALGILSEPATRRLTALVESALEKVEHKKGSATF